MNNNIHRTLRKVYLLHKMYNSKHSVGLGADSSRPYIIPRVQVKVKAFRAQFRGVTDIPFFLYRLMKLCA